MEDHRLLYKSSQRQSRGFVMKVYSVPEAVPYAGADYMNYDWKAEQARSERHMADLKKHLIEMGHKGKHTGKIARFPVADGYAEYMLADGKGQYGQSFLIHLPYGDGWHFQYISNVSKKEIIENITNREAITALFAKKKAV